MCADPFPHTRVPPFEPAFPLSPPRFRSWRTATSGASLCAGQRSRRPRTGRLSHTTRAMSFSRGRRPELEYQRPLSVVPTKFERPRSAARGPQRSPVKAPLGERASEVPAVITGPLRNKGGQFDRWDAEKPPAVPPWALSGPGSPRSASRPAVPRVLLNARSDPSRAVIPTPTPDREPVRGD